MDNIEIFKLFIILAIVFLISKLVGFAMKIIFRILIFIAILYIIFQYLHKLH